MPCQVWYANERRRADRQRGGDSDVTRCAGDIAVELMCDGVVLSRRQTDIAELRKEVESAIDEYPLIDWKYEVSCIYQPSE